MLPWTLASLINNTDFIMIGVHIYIACEAGTEDRIKTALKTFDLPENTIIDGDTESLVIYDAICPFDINCWAFRDGKNQIKLPIGDVLKQHANPSLKIEGLPSEPFNLKAPCLCDMQHATVEDFRHAMKQLMGAQLGITVP